MNDTMQYNFDLLEERILDTLNFTKSVSILKKIKGNTIFVGSGGSMTVACFASQVLNKLNNCPNKVVEPRDVLYENIKSYKNLFVCSYSGTNLGVNALKSLNIKKYLLTYSETKIDSYINFSCYSSLNKEKSFISLAASLMPMSILLSYYLKDRVKNEVQNMLNNAKNITFSNFNYNLDFDLMSGYDTLTPESYLESTFIESALANLTVHHKYNYCHGRSTSNYKNKRNLIYLLTKENELDVLLLNELKTRYEKIIILRSNYNDIILDNYYLTLQAMYFTKYLAEMKNKDLSVVDYDKPLSKALYRYEGNLK